MMPEGSITYPARIIGTLDANSLYPFADFTTYRDAQLTATDTVHQLLGGNDTVDFYLIARLDPSEPLYRVRWRLTIDYIGPHFVFDHPGGPHVSTIAAQLWLRPIGDFRQLTVDPADEDRPEMPYRTNLSGLYTALMLRRAWGTGLRHITVGAHGTVGFSPSTLSYIPLYTHAYKTVPYDTTSLAEYPFVLNENSGQTPALWLALAGAPIGEGWKVSYCAEPGHGAEDRWDDPNEAVPAYAPLEFASS